MLALRRWSVRHAAFQARAYRMLLALLGALRPAFKAIGYARAEKPAAWVESNVKGLFFDCHMCGYCLLSVNGMACPMNCPKSVRNGPCGGVRPDGGCEAKPQMQCVWVEGWRGMQRMPGAAFPRLPNPPASARHAGTSSWMRLARGEHTPPPISGAPATTTDSRLERLLRAGEFVVTAEFSPPDSADPADVSAQLGHFRDHVDAINVTDGSGANCHMSSLGVSALLVQAGCEPVTQISCRDRNRIAIQGDILGAAALGIRNLLCLTGDGTTVGDHADAKPVFDLDSMSLLQAARVMRDEGRFLSGRKIIQPPRLFLGGADNPFVPPFDMRPLRLARKIAAGAQFVQTQYCFDLDRLEAYMAQVRDEGLHERCHILIGVGPIASAKTARWLRTRVPGVHIPDAIVARLEGAENPRAEGRRICVELIQAIRGIRGVAGVHIMAPKQDDAIAGLVRDSGVLAARRPGRAREAAPSTP
ncbi:MAG: methylenetetrahydrofolate reductase C-terminal domain-containing protein [Betaproteobacteria bacterium]|nr:methylenetetrahydrofolate reductase C-terminal domain-containing protein [Betaproteobacteria bacterium]